MILFWLVSSALAQTDPIPGTSLINLMFHASPVVILTMLLLLFFSVATWTIIFLKLSHFREAQRQTISFLDNFWKAKNLSQVQGQLKLYERSPMAEIFRVGYTELGKLSKAAGGLEEGLMKEGAGLTGLDNLRRALYRAARSEMNKLSEYFTFLATTGNIAPFVGLFGTVVGIINAFRNIGLQGSASLATVAPGIAEALAAAAAGLAAAIPAVMAYNLFLSRARNLEAEMNAFASDFLNLVERDALRKAQAKRAA